MIMESVAAASQPKENHDDAPQLLIIIIVSPLQMILPKIVNIMAVV